MARRLPAGPVTVALCGASVRYYRGGPLAHLDRQARRALTRDLLTATEGRATLLITHDLDGLDQVDEIIVLDSGKVAERGTHEQLLAAAGRYRQMWLTRRSLNDAHKAEPGPVGEGTR